jgi:hypothetical protein
MTRISEADPIMQPTQAHENKGEKRRAGKFVIWAIMGIGLFAFAIYLAMAVMAVTQVTAT